MYLSIAEGYWDKDRGHARTKIIEKIGYLDEFADKFDDPIAHFEQVVSEMNSLTAKETAEYTISAKKNLTLEKNIINRKNYGYIIIMKLYYELGLDRYLINKRQRDTKIEFNTSAIMKLLIISRILTPGSKKRAYDTKERYFDFESKDVFKLYDVYRALSHFAALEKDIQLLIHNRITKTYGRNLDLIYYDVTNYYFEIDIEDDFRKKGVNKEHRPNPIVQMGLASDAEGLPISYEVFSGNESEKLHLRPAVFELRDRFNSGRVIAVADAAQNTGNNVYYLDQGKQGYVFSQSIRGASKTFKQYVLDDTGYEWVGSEYKKKSRIERREISVDFTRSDGTTYKKDLFVDQRQIIFYSEKFAVRSKAKRESALKKAHGIVQNPSAYTKATSRGALKYIMNVDVDKETGEIKEIQTGKPCINYDVIAEEEKYDGYYSIVTNVFDEGKNKGKFGDDKIIEIYRGLWRIEDSFSIIKGELEARPIFLSREDRIKAHFLICFISLVIVRLIQKHTQYKYSPEKIINALNDISCSHEGGNLYLFDYRSDISDALGEAFNIDFSKQRLTRSEIKKFIGAVKKS